MIQDRPTPLMLRQISLLRDVEEALLQRMAGDMWIEHRRRGQHLADARQADTGPFRNTAYFVFRGIVEIYSVTQHGGRKILFFQGPGKLLNLNVMNTCGDNHYGRAAEDAILLCMEREKLADYVRCSPVLTAGLLAHYESKIWRLSHQLKNTAGTFFIERKLAAKLLKLSADFGKPLGQGRVIAFDLTITQLADYIGVPRESVSRACRKLTELQLISYENRRFYIPDQTRLEQFRRQIQGCASKEET